MFARLDEAFRAAEIARQSRHRRAFLDAAWPGHLTGILRLGVDEIEASLPRSRASNPARRALRAWRRRSGDVGDLERFWRELDAFDRGGRAGRLLKGAMSDEADVFSGLGSALFGPAGYVVGRLAGSLVSDAQRKSQLERAFDVYWASALQWRNRTVDDFERNVLPVLHASRPLPPERAFTLRRALLLAAILAVPLGIAHWTARAILSPAPWGEGAGASFGDLLTRPGAPWVYGVAIAAGLLLLSRRAAEDQVSLPHFTTGFVAFAVAAHVCLQLTSFAILSLAAG